MQISNCYDDARRAEAYAKLEFPGAYYLAYRDLPKILRDHVVQGEALDVGCGTGRSTRFLSRLGFETIGVDIAKDMITKAREIDPEGNYHQVDDGNFSQFEDNAFDLVLSVFTFDNIPTRDKKVKSLREMGRLLKCEGRIVNLVSSPEVYRNEWVSFSTRDFPENRCAQSGDTVRIIVTDLDDDRPVEDVVWSDEDYQEVFEAAGLALVNTYRPLATEDEPYPWVNETRIAPWVIYVLRSA